MFLSLRAGSGYEELVTSRICEPLGLNDTRITMTPTMRERLAQGHDGSLHPVPSCELRELAGAGALRSTAKDMMRFLDACQGKRKTELSPAIASLLNVRRQTDKKDIYAAAGWFVVNAYSDELVLKEGQTCGYASFTGYSARAGIAAVLLSNTACWTTEWLGGHLLDTNFLLPKLRRQGADRSGETECLCRSLPVDNTIRSHGDT